MSRYHRIPRREFLRMMGVAASAAVLGACTSESPAVTAPSPTVAPPQPTPARVVPTATTILPTATASPPVSEVTSTPEPAVEIPVLAMVLVEAGSFEMGGTVYPDEQPVHTVRINRSFFIAPYAVTFEDYDRFRKNKVDDAGWGRGKRPVMGVDWYDAIAYCNWLSEKEGLMLCYSGKGLLTKCDFSASGYRLPTEAEWEYAARGGPKSQGYIYAGSDNPDDVAWYADNSGGQTHFVGQKQPNELGVYDMSGNVYEWCWDWYGGDYYALSPLDDPPGSPPTPEPGPRGPNKVRRSGSWRENAESVRVAFRSLDYASYPGENGFRLVRTKR